MPIGIQRWAKEGICGRGVLLVYVEYVSRHSTHYSAFSHYFNPLSVLPEIASEQGKSFNHEDILFFRIAVTIEWDTKVGIDARIAYATICNLQHAGVAGTEEMLGWTWDLGFADVARDGISFEVCPP